MLSYFEAEYNNRLKVADFAAIAAGWAARAASFRAGWEHAELGLAYGPGERHKLDLFWPGAAHVAPLAMFIHGGYWQALDRSFVSHLASGLLAHGVAVAMPSYDLCPSVTLAELTAQLVACATFLAARHGPGLLALGHSAGGHLTGMLMARAPGLIRAGMPISGLFDLAPLMKTTVMAGISLQPHEVGPLSPLFLPSPGLPLHAVVGGEEGLEYETQTSRFAAAWGGTWESLPGHNHFTVIDALAEPGSPMVRRAVALLLR